MSYLQTPRLVFAGRFQADVSTVNNDPEHFDTKNFLPSYDLPQTQTSANGWWNPRGSGAWRFFGCSVQRVVYKDGTSCDDPQADPVIGLAVNSADFQVEGKLVDLDPEQQMVSEIWGFRVILGAAGTGLGFHADFEPAAFGDLWARTSAPDDSKFSAYFQSALRVFHWIGAGESRFLKEWLTNGECPRNLSIKINTDGLIGDATSPNFTFGRVVGTIGLYAESEPKRFVAGRVLFGSGQSPAGSAYAQLDGNVLHLDLGNSLATSTPGGTITSQGPLTAAAQTSSNAVPLGNIDYYDHPTWYPQTAGIVSFHLTDQQLQAAQANPLIVNIVNGETTLLAEAANGLYVRADQFVFRLNPGETEKTKLYATQFGSPAANQPISWAYDPSLMQAQATAGPIPGPQKIGEPKSALTVQIPSSTASDGTADVTMTASDPGNPRVYIDGQLYGITYQMGATPPPIGSVQNGNQMISALVFSAFAGPAQPNWIEHVHPIFQQYANLYPIMRPIVDLGSYASVVGRLNILRKVFDTPITDPNYMPVTRDLSGGKRDMIRNWLAQKKPVYMDTTSVTSLKAALQIALELEHSTIPPYLCALYSIKQGANPQIAELIRSVVIEEMLHMALVANVLISIGGAPSFDHAGFVPRYPSSLPGGLRAGLNVRLRRCSIDHIRDCFMSIEEPEETIEIVKLRARAADPLDRSFFTIGWFYEQVERTLVNLGGQLEFGNASRQVTDWTGPGKLFAITSLDDARRALTEIQHQGEGRGPRDPDGDPHELAHYFKFAEIVEGRRLVIAPPPAKGFSYSGERIPFDPQGVWPMMDDPDVVLFPDGSRAQILSQQFSLTYGSLLKALHRCFNGSPDTLRESIGIMYSLDLAARELMQTPSGRNDGTTAGPSFARTVPGLT
jgi:hypothetical protein